MRLSTSDIFNSLNTILGLPISTTKAGEKLVFSMMEELNSRNYGLELDSLPISLLESQTTHAILVNLEIFLSLPISKHISSVELIFSMLEELNSRNVSAYPLLSKLGDNKLQEIIDLAIATKTA